MSEFIIIEETIHLCVHFYSFASVPAEAVRGSETDCLYSPPLNPLPSDHRTETASFLRLKVLASKFLRQGNFRQFGTCVCGQAEAGDAKPARAPSAPAPLLSPYTLWVQGLGLSFRVQV